MLSARASTSASTTPKDQGLRTKDKRLICVPTAQRKLHHKMQGCGKGGQLKRLKAASSMLPATEDLLLSGFCFGHLVELHVQLSICSFVALRQGSETRSSQSSKSHMHSPSLSLPLSPSLCLSVSHRIAEALVQQAGNPTALMECPFEHDLLSI